MAKEPAYPNIHQDLIDRCRERDRGAQFEIYRLYYKAMFNTSLRIVKDPGEAEDIMQESFLSAFDKIETYGGTVSFGAWLKKIVINRSLDSLKKHRLSFELLDERVLQDSEDMGESDDLSGRIEEIREAIMRLSTCSRDMTMRRSGRSWASPLPHPDHNSQGPGRNW